ncbi:enoyl-CoA hydratase/isomerase family protein [Frankia sp. CNm7]|uniref:Enoyl-CoA hydratase/isomerase family protein n=1 Tax=Frankia nepalensis TaxID=1836974 RepID=A0A937RTU2_9ACTN|nr:enoyl-CoA hydratase-related protein [Frankia nepalensis]MBL7497401.1 enoyl-CoA hydratase/isomerase family protein [Frankia nepalensis]MBL7512104.1 enoyl-CoA hydratase/isomerase family protein [Frankia nepalensis]MBL7519391.1 enoyl-CoA hydratase/isomerase family protein [Frankia nepalensis]MBL7631796.1 enoyl-CoA hydratase/isomerase family protein [Frankia nepalensis]
MAEARAFEDVRLDIDDPVAVVTIDRPASMNAFRGQTLRELREAFSLAERDQRVVGIVLTGAGDRAFSAGLDVAVLHAQVSGDGAAKPADDGFGGPFPGSPAMADMQRMLTWPLAIRKPVIAAVNGVCAGGAFLLAAACDLRFAADTARFTTVYSRRGLIAEQGVSWLLPRLVGPAHALDLLWSSRAVPAQEALAIGLAQRVVPPDRLLDECRAYIAELARVASPHSMMVSKQLVYQHLQRALGDAVDQTDALMRDALTRADPIEGAVSFLERRDPRFDRLDVLPPT